jgi:EpsI family protein
VPRFLNSTPARVASVLLLLQAGLLYSSIREEYVPEGLPLAGLPLEFGQWRFFRENVADPEVREVLQADDLVNRSYQNGVVGANLFVAAFRSQRTGKAPHSPKNCLPGSGWEWVKASTLPVEVGRAEPIVVNRYIVARGQERSLVMYWYQSRDRVVASEYEAKFWVMADAIRYNRTDTALVRVVVPIGPDKDEARAERYAVDFIQSFFSTLSGFLPS